MQLESRPVNVLYDTGDRIRSLHGVLAGETDDGLFFVVVRPLGDRVLVAKAHVRSITEEAPR